MYGGASRNDVNKSSLSPFPPKGWAFGVWAAHKQKIVCGRSWRIWYCHYALAVSKFEISKRTQRYSLTCYYCSLSRSAPEEVGSVLESLATLLSETMNGTLILTFSLFTNSTNHLFFDANHLFLQINPFKSKCSLKNSNASLLTANSSNTPFHLNQVSYLFSVQFPISISNERKENQLW